MSRIPHKASRFPYGGGGYAPYDLPVHRGGGNGGPAIDYATWNPDDKHSSYTLSGDNLVITKDFTNTWRSARASLPAAFTGMAQNDGRKFIWEVDYVIGSGNATIGVGNLSADLTTYAGDADGHSIAFGINGGVKFYGGSGAATWAGYSGYQGSSAVITFLLDTSVSPARLAVKGNGSLRGTYEEIPVGLVGALFPMISIYDNLGYATCNFGQSAFQYPESGYVGVSA